MESNNEDGCFTRGLFSKSDFFGCTSMKDLGVNSDELFEQLKNKSLNNENRIQDENPKAKHLIKLYQNLLYTDKMKDCLSYVIILMNILYKLNSIPFDKVIPKLSKGDQPITCGEKEYYANDNAYLRTVNRLWGKNTRSAKSIFTFIFLNGGKLDTNDTFESLAASAITGVVCTRCEQTGEKGCTCGRFQKVKNLIFGDSNVRKCYMGLNFVGTEDYPPPFSDKGIIVKESIGSSVMGRMLHEKCDISIYHDILLTECILYLLCGRPFDESLMKHMPDICVDIKKDMDLFKESELDEKYQMIRGSHTLNMYSNYLITMFAAGVEHLFDSIYGGIPKEKVMITEHHPYAWLVALTQIKQQKGKVKTTIYRPAFFLQMYLNRDGYHYYSKGKSCNYIDEPKLTFNIQDNEINNGKTFEVRIKKDNLEFKSFFEELKKISEDESSDSFDSLVGDQSSDTNQRQKTPHVAYFCPYDENTNKKILKIRRDEKDECYLHMSHENKIIQQRKNNLITYLLLHGCLTESNWREPHASSSSSTHASSMSKDSSSNRDEDKVVNVPKPKAKSKKFTGKRKLPANKTGKGNIPAKKARKNNPPLSTESSSSNHASSMSEDSSSSGDEDKVVNAPKTKAKAKKVIGKRKVPTDKTGKGNLLAKKVRKNNSSSSDESSSSNHTSSMSEDSSSSESEDEAAGTLINTASVRQVSGRGKLPVMKNKKDKPTPEETEYDSPSSVTSSLSKFDDSLSDNSSSDGDHDEYEKESTSHEINCSSGLSSKEAEKNSNEINESTENNQATITTIEDDEVTGSEGAAENKVGENSGDEMVKSDEEQASRENNEDVTGGRSYHSDVEVLHDKSVNDIPSTETANTGVGNTADHTVSSVKDMVVDLNNQDHTGGQTDLKADENIKKTDRDNTWMLDKEKTKIYIKEKIEEFDRLLAEVMASGHDIPDDFCLKFLESV